MQTASLRKSSSSDLVQMATWGERKVGKEERRDKEGGLLLLHTIIIVINKRQVLYAALDIY